MMTPLTLKVFVSSPGDVGVERELSNRVLQNLQAHFSDRAKLEAIFWEQEPLRATASFNEELIPPSEADIFIVILWSRLGTQLPKHFARPDGSPYLSGTEFEFEDAFAAFQKHGRPDVLVYRKMAEPIIGLRDRQAAADKLRQWDALNDFISKWFHDGTDGSLIAAFHPFDAPATFEELLEVHLRKLIERRLPADAVRGQGGAYWSQGAPFRGLEVFEPEHAPIFFGRTRAVADLLQQLHEQDSRGRPLVVVLGASGSGKSSLCRAGVLPMLAGPGVVEGIGSFRQAIFTPSAGASDLLLGLSNSLIAQKAIPELLTEGATAAQIAELLRTNPQLVGQRIAEVLAKTSNPSESEPANSRTTTSRLILLVDQFEEVFTLPSVSVDERQLWEHALAALVRSNRVWILITLRNDFYGRMQEMEELSSLKGQKGQYDLQPFEPSELTQIIRQPAIVAGLTYESNDGESLDNVIRDDAMHDRAMPLIEFALRELYERRQGTLLTFDAYREIGGVQGAVARQAEQAILSLSHAGRQSLENILPAMVTITLGESETITKLRANREQIAAGYGAAELIGVFVSMRLFVSDTSSDGQSVVYAAHEALLHNWPRCRDWIERNRRGLRVRARLEAAAAEWNEGGRRASYLLAPARYRAAKKGIAGLGQGMTAELKAYLQASAGFARRDTIRRSVLVTATLAVLFCFGIWGWNLNQLDRRRNEAAELSVKLENDIIAANRAEATKTGEQLIHHLEDLSASAPAENDLQLRLAMGRAKYAQALLLDPADEKAAAEQAGLALRDESSADLDTQYATAFSAVFAKLGDAISDDEWTSTSLSLWKRTLEIRERFLGQAFSELEVSDACTMLGHRLESKKRFDEALVYYHRAVKYDQSTPGYLVSDHQDLGDAYYGLRNYAAALEHYRKRLTYQTSLASFNTDDRESLGQLALAHCDVAKTLSALGKLAESASSYRECLSFLEQRIKKFPDDNEAHLKRFYRLRDLASVLNNQGRVRNALDVRLQACEISENRLAKSPKDADRLDDLGLVKRDITTALLAMGQFNKASETSHQAVAHLEEAHRLEPSPYRENIWNLALADQADIAKDSGRSSDAEATYLGLLSRWTALRSEPRLSPTSARSNLAYAQTSLGMIAVLKGNLTKAEEYHTAAHDAYDALCKEFPADLGYSISLARRKRSLGILAHSRWRLHEASTQFREALKIVDQNVSAAPEQIHWTEFRADILSSLATLANWEGELKSARTHLNESLQLNLQAASVDAESVAAKSDVAWSWRQLGTNLSWAGRDAEAMEFLEKAVQAYRECEQTDSKGVAARVDRIGAQLAVGDALLLRGRYTEAVAHLRPLLAEYDELCELDPVNTTWRNTRASIQNSLSEALLATEQVDEALKHFTAAHTTRSALVLLDSTNVEWRHLLAFTLDGTARALLKAGRLAEAHDAARKAIDIRSQLQTIHDSGTAARSWALAYRTRGRIELAQDRRSEAVESFRTAHARLAKEVESHPDAANWQKDLAETCLDLGSAVEDPEEAASVFQQGLDLAKKFETGFQPATTTLVEELNRAKSRINSSKDR